MHVADSHSFTAAADRLGMSKATVSKHVSRLETDLGVRLLKRTTRSVALTGSGARFYGHCQQIMAELAAATAEIKRANGADRERFRVGAVSAFGHLDLAEASRIFRERNSGLEIEIIFSDRIDDPAEAGFDAAIRIDRRSRHRRQRREIASCRQIVCAAPRYLDLHEKLSLPGQLVNHNCLICSALGDGDSWHLDGAQGSHSIQVSGRLRVNCGDALRLSLLAGLGIALVPELLVRGDLEAGHLRNVLPGYADDSYSLYAIFPDNAVPSSKLAEFFDFLESYYCDPPAWRPEFAADIEVGGTLELHSSGVPWQGRSQA